MRIGELAELSNTPARSLRYYEEQGLISPERRDNGYRDYAPALVERVVQIRGLIDSGISTRTIAMILPCLDGTRRIVPDDTHPELLSTLREERDRMTRHIGCLSRNRDAISAYIDAAESRAGAPLPVPS